VNVRVIGKEDKGHPIGGPTVNRGTANCDTKFGNKRKGKPTGTRGNGVETEGREGNASVSLTYL